MIRRLHLWAVSLVPVLMLAAGVAADSEVATRADGQHSSQPAPETDPPETTNNDGSGPCALIDRATEALGHRWLGTMRVRFEWLSYGPKDAPIRPRDQVSTWTVFADNDGVCFTNEATGIQWWVTDHEHWRLDPSDRTAVIHSAPAEPFEEMWWLLTQSEVGSPASVRRSLLKDLALARVTATTGNAEQCRLTYELPAEADLAKRISPEPESVAPWEYSISFQVDGRTRVSGWSRTVRVMRDGVPFTVSQIDVAVVAWRDFEHGLVPQAVERSVDNEAGHGKTRLEVLGSDLPSAPQRLSIEPGWQVTEVAIGATYTVGSRDLFVRGLRYRLPAPLETVPLRARLAEFLRDALPDPQDSPPEDDGAGDQ
ncbi:MAG: hypothetical protein KF724_08820 [Phycisphaeraceae bacterium]|nr:hypothetical protein [Phycisphaeraceae bacterium]